MLQIDRRKNAIPPIPAAMSAWSSRVPEAGSIYANRFCMFFTGSSKPNNPYTPARLDWQDRTQGETVLSAELRRHK